MKIKIAKLNKSIRHTQKHNRRYIRRKNKAMFKGMAKAGFGFQSAKVAGNYFGGI